MKHILTVLQERNLRLGPMPRLNPEDHRNHGVVHNPHNLHNALAVLEEDRVGKHCAAPGSAHVGEDVFRVVKVVRSVSPAKGATYEQQPHRSRKSEVVKVEFAQGTRGPKW